MPDLVTEYFDAWNDTDDESRSARLKTLLDEAVEMVDPDWTAHGRDAAITAIGQARAKLGTLRLQLDRVIHAHHDATLFSWNLTDTESTIATGYGVLRASNGRIAQSQTYFG